MGNNHQSIGGGAGGGIANETDPVYNAEKSGFATSSHNHDSRYYTETEIDTQMSGKADISHHHDSRYYTEAEIDTQMSGKASTNHTHNASQITSTKFIIGSTSGTVTPNYASGNYQIISASGNITFANPTNMNNDGDELEISVTASGANRTITAPTGNSTRFFSFVDLLSGKSVTIRVKRESSTLYHWHSSEQSL
jgi:hypothetical protein